MGNIQEHLYKKNLKTRLTKQEKRQKKKLQKQKNKTNTKGNNDKKDIIDEQKQSHAENPVDDKVVFNKESKIVFNKIDFTGVGKKNRDRRVNKSMKDPKVILEEIKKSKRKLNELEESGESVQAKKMKEKQMWSTALQKSAGVKVKDDELRLKRSMRKQKEMKNKSKKKWNVRVEATKKQKEDRQKKRQENIALKKKERKGKKLKRAIKKGRVVLQ